MNTKKLLEAMVRCLSAACDGAHDGPGAGERNEGKIDS